MKLVMRMKMNRFLKTIDCMNSSIFDEEVSKFFNDESIRIVDVKYDTCTRPGELHYIAFIVGEYSIPDDEEDSHE